MVWFQCEDCGENLKKPKLPNHFRQCYASKLSCIDCGQVFGRDDVEGHTQCITEMVHASSRFVIDGKYVRLAVKNE